MHHALVMSDEPSTPAFLYSKRVGISDEFIKVIKAQTPSLADEHEHRDDIVVGRLDNQCRVFGHSATLD
jgi:hypothetical protein